MELSMTMFLGLMGIVGLVLTIYAFKIAPDVKDCDSKTQNALRGLLVMGVIMLSVSSTLFACGMNNGYTGLANVFIVLMLIVGITTISLSSIIHGACEKARGDTPALITVSVIMTVMTGGFLMYKGYKSVKGNNQKMSF